METSIGLVKLDQATRMLAEIHSVDDAKHLINLAEAARVYAKQVELGLEAQNHAAEIKLRAQRRAGEILDTMEKADGGDAARTRSQAVTEVPAPPTYVELGIDKMDAHRWQTIAKMPEEKFEEYIERTKGGEKELTTAGAVRASKELEQERKREELRRYEAPQTSERYQLICDDFRNCASALAGKVDIIITDPPYPREYLPLYGDLATFAADVLRPGGLLLAMAGQSYLPEVIAQMCIPLTYHWTIAYLTPGGQSPQVWPRKVNTFWKPVLVFVNGQYTGDWFGDVCKSAVNDNDKRFHGWGQSESGMVDIIERFTQPGWTVLDPFCGGGTTGMAALALGRRFIGVEIDKSIVEIAAGRLSQC